MAGDYLSGYFFQQGTTLRSGGTSFIPGVPTSQLSMYLNLGQSDTVRLQKYQLNWNFYFGKQWSFDRPEDDAPLVVRNYLQLIVNKSATWLVKNGFVNKPPDSLKKFVGSFLDEVWDNNKKQIFLNELAQIGAVTGDAYIFITVEPPENGEPVTEKNIKIFAKNSQQCFPIVDPQDKTKMVAIKIVSFYYDKDEAIVERVTSDQAKVEVKLKRFTQIFTKDQIIEQYEGKEPVIKRNIIGEIPVIHIQNLPVAVDFFGMADIDGIIEMQRELNEKSTDISDIISYHSSPLMVGYGFKASQVERHTKSFWTGLPEGSKLEIMNSNADLGHAVDFAEGIKNSMLEISETPKILLDAPPISNTSGVALSLQYQPIVDKVGSRKKPMWEDGLQSTNRVILKYGEAFNLVYLPRDMCKHCEGKILTVQSASPFKRPVRKCFLVDENFVLATKEKAAEIWNLEESDGTTKKEGTEEKEDKETLIKTEMVMVSTVQTDPETGETQVIDEQLMELVPTDCHTCRAADPLEAPVEFLDALPRDDQVEADFWLKLSMEKIVSRAYVRRQIRRIDPADIERIERELKEEQAEEIEVAKQLAEANAVPPAANNPPGQTPGEEELKRSSLPGGHNQPKKDPGGNKVK